MPSCPAEAANVPSGLIATLFTYVHELRSLARIEHDVVRLHVAMDHTEAVGVLKCVGQFSDPPRGCGKVWPIALDASRESFAMDELRRDENVSVDDVAFKYGHNVRMPETSRRFGFGQKSLEKFEIVLANARHLERDLPIEHRVMCSIDLAETSFAQQLSQLNASNPCGWSLAGCGGLWQGKRLTKRTISRNWFDCIRRVALHRRNSYDVTSREIMNPRIC
jgi:hypothetical protein